ncbi:MAG: hypothetical protein WKF40_01860 [Thermoleophilaceae bacterium]
MKVISPLLSALEYRAEWVRWLAWVLAAVVAYVVCAAFYIGADPWDPLADWGPVLLIGSSLALGLLGGRWPLVLDPVGAHPAHAAEQGLRAAQLQLDARRRS